MRALVPRAPLPSKFAGNTTKTSFKCAVAQQVNSRTAHPGPRKYGDQVQQLYSRVEEKFGVLVGVVERQSHMADESEEESDDESEEEDSEEEDSEEEDSDDDDDDDPPPGRPGNTDDAVQRFAKDTRARQQAEREAAAAAAAVAAVAAREEEARLLAEEALLDPAVAMARQQLRQLQAR